MLYAEGQRVEFEWDEDKNRGNRLKHGVSFAVAIEAFDDPFELSEPALCIALPLVGQDAGF